MTTVIDRGPLKPSMFVSYKKKIQLKYMYPKELFKYNINITYITTPRSNLGDTSSPFWFFDPLSNKTKVVPSTFERNFPT